MDSNNKSSNTDNKSDLNVDTSTWDKSKVKDMTAMFKPSDLNVDVSTWDTSKVEDIDVTQLDISKLDISEIQNRITKIQDKSSNVDNKSEIKPKK